MSEKQFVVNELEILNEENEWKGEYWWAVVNTQRVEDCFECRNKEVALKLCDFLNKATDDFKWQIKQSEKWSAKVKQLEREVDEQQATITSLKDENLYNNFKLKSVDDLKKLKDIFEICMILIDGAITDEDLELGYESVFQFERRIKKFNGDLNE